LPDRRLWFAHSPHPDGRAQRFDLKVFNPALSEILLGYLQEGATDALAMHLWADANDVNLGSIFVVFPDREKSGCVAGHFGPKKVGSSSMSFRYWALAASIPNHWGKERKIDSRALDLSSKGPYVAVGILHLLS